jgi:hypothetical protein
MRIPFEFVGEFAGSTSAVQAEDEEDAAAASRSRTVASR